MVRTMPRNLLFVAALIAGISYFFSDAVTTEGVGHLIWKGAGVGLLALWAATRARSADGWILALAFAIYAAADVLIEIFGLVGGAATFIAGHLLMILLYLRYRRRPLSSEDWMIVGLMLIAVPLASFLLPERRDDAVKVVMYAAVLGALAAAALASEFRRDRVLLGTMLFVASDLLIFARLGALSDSIIPDLGVWPLYFAGQALVAAGVAQELEARGK